jgi:hypothetical protein
MGYQAHGLVGWYPDVPADSWGVQLDLGMPRAGSADGGDGSKPGGY